MEGWRLKRNREKKEKKKKKKKKRKKTEEACGGLRAGEEKPRKGIRKGKKEEFLRTAKEAR